jgi:hypothetical protein
MGNKCSSQACGEVRPLRSWVLNERHPRAQHYRDDHAGGYSPPCRPRDTRHLTMEKVPPGRLPKGELLCVGRNLGLCVLALCFAFVALR